MTDDPRNWEVATRLVRGGTTRSQYGETAEALYLTQSFIYDSAEAADARFAGTDPGFIYTRYGNPSLSIAEGKIAALEGAEAAVVTASGMAAISHALLAVLQAGDEVISSAQLYGGTYRLMRDVFPRLGITVRQVETDLARLDSLLSPLTKVLYIETPTNPTVRLVDLQKAVTFAKKHNLIAIIDNPSATPVLQQPLSLGFDMVVHSATKGLAGHSDVIAGAVAGSKAWMDKIQHMVIYLGGSMDPEAAFLLSRGIKTLALRVKRQGENAIAIAKYLEKHPKVARVHYPGLASHPDHKLAKRQMRGFGSMLAFDLKGGLSAARRFWNGPRILFLRIRRKYSA